MCGIVAYIGPKEAYPILVKGLQRLEYRGYDSAGVVMLKHGSLNLFKKAGKVADLKKYAEAKDTTGNVGIGHTRWATHGVPNDVNAHPTSPIQAGLPSSTMVLSKTMLRLRNSLRNGDFPLNRIPIRKCW